jgi:hypothetical protein
VNPYWLYIKWGVVLAVLLGCTYGGYHYRDLSCKRDEAQAESAALKAQRAETERWQRIANETDEKLQKALQAPKAAPKIREVIRATPSHCNVPKPVADSLRNAIRDGNAAVSR